MENMEFDRTRKEFRRRVTIYNSPFSSWLTNELDRSDGQFNGFRYESQLI
jgi:hypothetical protein